MLLGFYDRNGNGLAVELSPEMAKAIASRAREIFAALISCDCFSSTVEIRLAELALEEIFRTQDSAVPAKEPCDGFFRPLESFVFAASGRALWSTGVWLDVQQYRAIGGEPTTFWEFYANYERQCTPSLSLSQLDAIAANQPLPIE